MRHLSIIHSSDGQAHGTAALRLIGAAAVGGALGLMSIYAGIAVLTRNVDKGFEARYIALHKSWIAKGIEPSGEIAAADAPPRGTDW